MFEKLSKDRKIFLLLLLDSSLISTYFILQAEKLSVMERALFLLSSTFLLIFSLTMILLKKSNKQLT
jgi:hypothetical protein